MTSVIEADRIVERVSSSGVKAATTVELVAIALSRRAEDVPDSHATSVGLLKRYGSIRGLQDASFADLHELTGLERFEVLQMQALLELGRRSSEAERGNPPEIDSLEKVERQLRRLKGEKKEHFVALLLDSQLRLIKESTIHIGTLTMSIVGPREVFREAIREGASGIIVAHNHPSGDPTPSPEDIQVTRELASLGNMLDITLYDHVIIGDSAVSLKERGAF